jgi:ABC-type antimicrobial peptide transport system permease subunit
VFDEDDVTSQIARGQLNLLLGVSVHSNPPRGKLVAGRFLDASDSGKYNVVLPQTTELSLLGVHVGSTLTYRLGSAVRDFTVVGLVNPDARAGLIPLSLGDGAIQVPINAVSPSVPFDPIIANVAPQSVNDAMAAVGAVPGVLVVDLGFFDSIINRLLSQAAALPLLVAGFSLFAAAVLIATTVSLATLERRRQIAILKALGVTRLQALNQILIENMIVGLAGGVISLVPTLLVFILVPILTRSFIEIQLPVPYDLMAIMLALSVLITIVATLLTAWSASSEKPLAALRYE